MLSKKERVLEIIRKKERLPLEKLSSFYKFKNFWNFYTYIYGTLKELEKEKRIKIEEKMTLKPTILVGKHGKKLRPTGTAYNKYVVLSYQRG